MKKKAFLICLVCCLGLTGCVSDSQFKALEERVAELEEKIDKQATNGSASNETTTSVIPAAAETSNEPSETPMEEKKEYSYSLEGLSVDDIFSECKYCLYNLPQPGQSYEEFENSQHGVPIQVNTDPRDIYYIFTTDKYFSSESQSQNIVYSIYIEGYEPQMDGNIGLDQGGRRIGATVTFFVSDYDMAVELYNKIYDELSPFYENVSNHTEGTSWSADGDQLDEKFGIYDSVGFVSLLKMDDSYQLQVKNYTYRPQQ